MNEVWKKWLIKSAGFGASFALTLSIVAGGAAWYVFRPKPPKPPNPWNRTAIRAEFLEPATSDTSASINLWYTLTNAADADYRIDNLAEIVTAGLTKDNDAFYEFNQGISFDVPLIILAHRNTVAILHVPFQSERLSVPDDASDSAVTTYKKNVMIFLRSKYANLKGFAILDEGTRYEIDFPLP